ncbi:MAG: beta-ketoacyl-[acyl-carrier-protein] synthase family protein, partial [Planctomycetales bacterium]
MRNHGKGKEPVVITGIGMAASVGADRESVWQALRRGESGVRRIRGMKGIPDDLFLGAPIDFQPDPPERLKVLDLCHMVAEEALRDARIEQGNFDRDRFGCAVSAHIGELQPYNAPADETGTEHQRAIPWWSQWLPNTACVDIARRFGLHGPRLCHATACASGSMEILSAAHAVQDGACDMMLAGAGEVLHPLVSAGFRKMKVLAEHEDPKKACRPFDVNRNGFVMGEGASMFVIERLSSALERGARIYAEILAGRAFSEAQHVTSLDVQSDGLSYAVNAALRKARLAPGDIDYINVHGTGTHQNDLVESASIRKVFGRAADSIPVSAVKSMIGHLLNAAGSMELAITAMALRDGFIPPTINLTDPDPECELDHVALVGSVRRPQVALKISVAFGGHLVALILRRWND